MIDKIIELEDYRKYLILDETILNDVTYYYGIKLDDNEEPTASYLFFEEIKDDDNVYLYRVEDEKLKGVLLTSFTINYLDMIYDEV